MKKSLLYCCFVGALLSLSACAASSTGSTRSSSSSVEVYGEVDTGIAHEKRW